MPRRPIRNATAPKRKRRRLQRVKPRRYTLVMLLALSAFLLIMVIFTPAGSPIPAQNVTGDDVAAPEKASNGNRAFRITEVMSSNRSAFPDETGAFPDWVEVTNTSAEPIQVGGYGLSDRDDKILFVFPDIQLAAGQHLIVFASDYTRNDDAGALHANFNRDIKCKYEKLSTDDIY